jgi:hypothetical protein
MDRIGRSLILVFVLGGCSDSYSPIVDMKGVVASRYERDLSECRGYGDLVDNVREEQIVVGGCLRHRGYYVLR